MIAVANKNEAKILFKAETAEFNDAIQSANSEMSTLRAEMKLNEAQFANTGDKSEYLEQKTQLLEAQIQANTDKQEALNQKIEAAKQIYGENSEEVAKLERQLLNAKTEEEKLKTQLDVTNQGFEDQAQAAEQSGSSIDAMAEVMTNAELAKMVKEIADAAFEMAQSFDEASATIVEGTGASGEALEDLNRQAMDAFGRIADADQNINGVSGILAGLNTRFGVTGDELEDLTVKMANFAQHTGTNGVGAVNSIANVMKRWGLDLDDVDGLLDDLTTANQSCQLSVDQLSSYLAENSVQFKEFGYSTEDALALLISLSDGGANVSSVLSGMKKAVGTLSDVTDDVPGAFQDAISAIGECGSVSEALQAQIGDTGKTVEEVFGSKAAQELAVNVLNGNFAIDQWTEALQSNSGALDQTTENATTMGDAMSQVSNALAMSLAPVTDVISSVASSVADVVSQAAIFIQQSPVAQAVVVGLATVFGILAAAIAIGATITAVTTLTGVMTLLTNPVFLVIAAVAALVAALVYAYNNCEEFRAIVNAAFAAVRNVATNVFTSVRNTVTTVFNTISSIAHSISATLSSVWNGIKTTASSVWNSIRSTASSIWNSIRSTASSVWNGIRTAITNPIQAASSTVQGIINRIKGFFPISIGRIMSNLKLPHFSISGEFSLNPPKVPSFDIDWYAKGIIFNAPTLIPTMNGVKGVGEAGPEAVSPISVLQTYVGSAVQRYAPQIDYDRIGEKVAGACAKLGISIEVDKRQLGRVVREVVT